MKPKRQSNLMKRYKKCTKVHRLGVENFSDLDYEKRTRGRRRQRERERDNKGKQGKKEKGNEAGEGEGTAKLRGHFCIIVTCARSYYRHTWCNILPLIFASVRGFLPRPQRDFTSSHTVRDATDGSSPPTAESGVKGIEKGKERTGGTGK